MKLIKKTLIPSQTWMGVFEEEVEIICQGTDEDIKNALEGVIKEECKKYDDLLSYIVMDYIVEQGKVPIPDRTEDRNAYEERCREALVEFEKTQQEIQRLKKLRKELIEGNLKNVDPYSHHQGWSEQPYKYEIVE
jgi:diketogulonate reductase-like aldo/keto reductase